MKNFIMGIVLTLVIEGCVFCYYTMQYSVQINRTYSYNPQAIVNMLGPSFQKTN